MGCDCRFTRGFTCLECYDREKRRRKTITKKMNDDNNV